MTTRARALLAAFAALGLAASAAATWVHYQLLANPDYASFCDISTTVSCKQAYLSRYGSVAGVPVAVGGVIFFTLILLLVWAGRRGRPAADSAAAYIVVASTAAVGVVLYLAYASFFVLKEVCPLCVATYVAVIGLFVVSGGANSLRIARLPGRAARDARVLIGRPAALVIALLFLGATVSAVMFFPQPQQAGAAAPAAPVLSQDQRSEFERWWDVQEKVDVPYAHDGAKVLVVKFNDYQCPPCRQTYLAFESVLAQYRASDVNYLIKHFPLDPSCNAAVSSLVHAAACDAAAAAIMAGRKGTADALSAWFFAHQEELSPATVRTAARSVGGITNFEAGRAAALKEVAAIAAEGAKLGVRKTPTFFVNGRRIEGGLPPQYFKEAIDLELKRAR
ncbi:MAG: vitamin K epoxide reductase family protein [Vicinamibacterales bacterium]